MKEIEFKIKGLMMDPLTNNPIVVLQETSSETLLPISGWEFSKPMP